MRSAFVLFVGATLQTIDDATKETFVALWWTCFCDDDAGNGIFLVKWIAATKQSGTGARQGRNGRAV